MRRRGPARAILVRVAALAACALACSLVVFAHREMTRRQLADCVGRPFEEVVTTLRLADAERHWVDEPPAILRGVVYATGDGRRVTLYLAEGEPLYRKASLDFEWDYSAVLRCRVGGVQYEGWGQRLNIGPAVPWQWLPP